MGYAFYKKWSKTEKNYFKYRKHLESKSVNLFFILLFCYYIGHLIVEPAGGGASNPSALRCSCCNMNKSAFLSHGLSIILNFSAFLLIVESSELPKKL